MVCIIVTPTRIIQKTFLFKANTGYLHSKVFTCVVVNLSASRNRMHFLISGFNVSLMASYFRQSGLSCCPHIVLAED